MELIKRIWNDRPESESTNRRAGRGLCLFFAFMICCTVISRAADSLTVAEAFTENPKRMALSHTLEVTGILEPADKLPVLGPENGLVTGVNVKEGDLVEAGEALFTVDTSDTRREVQQKALELSKLELELDEIEQKKLLREEKNKMALDRAFDDYDAEMESEAFKVKSARDAMNQAKHDMREYVRDGGGEDDFSDAAYEALRDTYLEKKRLYEEAQLEEQRALTKAGRSIEDAIPDEYDREKELKQADIEAKRLELAALQKNLITDGVVCAPQTGAVVTINAAAGKRLGGEVAVYLSTGGVQFAAEITQKQSEEASRADTVQLKLPGNKKLDNLAVALRPVADKSGVYRMTVDAPEGETGMAVTAVLQRKTETFETCVPLSAVQGQGLDAYVMKVRETDTPLGLETSVERIPVTVEDSNETYAAVNGPFSSKDRIVIESAYLSDGQRIRPVEP